MSDDQVPAIKKVIEAYIDRLNASDTDGILALCADDAVLMEPGQDTAVGRQQLAASYERGFTACAMQFSFQFEHIITGDDLAVVHTTSSGAVTLKDSGVVVPASGRELYALKRTGGDWKIAQYMFQQVPVGQQQ